MCGIVGLAAPAPHAPRDLASVVDRMLRAVEHRGPDDWGVALMEAGRVAERSLRHPDAAVGGRGAAQESTVALGHRRLAIIDLSDGGHQPMRTADGRFWITYGGEIYNHRALRKELESQGTSFRSTSDTEVLLALWARDGIQGLGRLRGMFAFAVWDDARGELFLARDRFGIKPLYYGLGPGGLVLFGSELRPLLASGLCSRELDPGAELEFLARGSVRAPATIHRELRALPPGHWARWSAGSLEVRPYWSLDEAAGATSPRPAPAAEAAGRIRDALVESVQAHLVADVPVGVFLSGGLDSTAVLAGVRRIHSGPLRTFTLVFPGTRWDEGGLARQAAARYGTEHLELAVTRQDFYAAAEEIFGAMDQPTVDGVNAFFVGRLAARAGAKVALSGLGGDECLGGYDSFVRVPRIHRALALGRRAPRLGSLAARLAGRLPAAWAPKLTHLLERPDLPLEGVWERYRGLFPEAQLVSLAGRAVAPAAAPRAAMGDPFATISRLEMERFMIPQLLRDADVFTMCHGIELRTPFVDHVFLDAVRRAGRWRRGAASYKLALARAMGDFLPAEHLAGPKRGFTLPFEQWLRHALLETAPGGFARDFQGAMGKPDYRPFVEGFVRGRVHWSRVWSLYVLERFKR